ncbi:S8 family serine peptidase [Candidatus Pelagibacter sp.]|nr:S8 family serine peptidase [Candidatus Pelagibacter sp.]
MKNISKILAILSLPLLLSACGGGGGGGGAAAGGVGTGTVTNCTDGGTDYQGYEYYNGGGDTNQNAGNNSPLQYVCASSAYARGATGNGIQVAVVDTGIRATHTELDDNMVSALTGSDTINADNNPVDDHGHGTHVAGIIAAERSGGSSSGYTHGVAYDADIYAIKMFNSSGSTTATAKTNAYALVEATAAIDIVNNSWGTDTDCTSASNCRTVVGSGFYDNWEDTAQLSTPKISVFAAGNDGDAEPSAQCQTMKYNSDINAVSICVVAVSTSVSGADYSVGKGMLASFSDKCGSVAAYCIAAPGDDIWAAGYGSNSQHVLKSGTSMAAPMVSGGLALVMQEFSSLTPAQVVTRLLTTASDGGEYSQTTIYGHGMMNLNAATTAVAQLQTINGSSLLDDPNTSYKDLVDNSFVSSASFSNALNSALAGQTMEVYDSFDRANFEVGVSSFFTSGSYTSQNTVENHMARLHPKTMEKVKTKNLYGNFTVETDGNYIESSMFQSAGDFLALGFNQSTNSFENAVDPLSGFFNDSNFGNNYLVNPYFHAGSGQDYFMSFNSNSSFGMDTFTNANGNDLGLAFNLNPLSSTSGDAKYAGDLQIVLGTNYEQNKFLNSTSTGAFATGDMSNTNFTGVKYKKSLGDDFTFVGSGFAGYTHIDKASNSYIDKSTPLLTSTFTLGLAKANFIKKDQRIGFFVNQPQRVEDGSLNLRVPTSSDRDRTVTYSNLNVDLEPDARQINLDIIFQKAVTETSNLSANLTHVQNGDHSNSSKDQNFISLFYKKTF